eukprot:TRINITY_DN8302_c1_g1_i1.p1 TRINITY_DN8302_c1_g1~~TRINITY_DN8302_c1_g1_i1.p1  ORF type:complete len:1233 (-),score=226.89 TRINITY_DN8302_c1_g1_i1:48-3746(-)
MRAQCTTRATLYRSPMPMTWGMPLHPGFIVGGHLPAPVPRNPQPGSGAIAYVFLFTSKTMPEVFERALVGASTKELSLMRTCIGKNTQIFLVNTDTLELFGSFRLAGAPGANLAVGAFGGRLSAQLRVQPMVLPLRQGRLQRAVGGGPKMSAEAQMLKMSLWRGTPVQDGVWACKQMEAVAQAVEEAVAAVEEPTVDEEGQSLNDEGAVVDDCVVNGDEIDALLATVDDCGLFEDADMVVNGTACAEAACYASPTREAAVGGEEVDQSELDMQVEEVTEVAELMSQDLQLDYEAVLASEDVVEEEPAADDAPVVFSVGPQEQDVDAEEVRREEPEAEEAEAEALEVDGAEAEATVVDAEAQEAETTEGAVVEAEVERVGVDCQAAERVEGDEAWVNAASAEEADPDQFPLLRKYMEVHGSLALAEAAEESMNVPIEADDTHEVCVGCGGEVHECGTCPLAPPERSAKDAIRYCGYCRNRGHSGSDCPTLASRQHVSLSSTRCLRCGLTGHANCKQPLPGKPAKCGNDAAAAAPPSPQGAGEATVNAGEASPASVALLGASIIPKAKSRATHAGWQTPSPGTTGPEHKPAAGYVFVCNNATEGDCNSLQMFGAPNRELDQMKRSIGPDTQIFLFSIERAVLIGVFAAVGMPSMNIERGAWKGRFPAQVRVAPREAPLMQGQLPQKTFGGPKTTEQVEALRECLRNGSACESTVQQAWRVEEEARATLALSGLGQAIEATATSRATLPESLDEVSVVDENTVGNDPSSHGVDLETAPSSSDITTGRNHDIVVCSAADYGEVEGVRGVGDGSANVHPENHSEAHGLNGNLVRNISKGASSNSMLAAQTAPSTKRGHAEMQSCASGSINENSNRNSTQTSGKGQLYQPMASTTTSPGGSAGLARGGSAGYVFHCNDVTQRDCEAYKVFGAMDGQLHLMKTSITSDTKLFMLNTDSMQLMGTFVAVDVPQSRAVPGAFNNRFNAQVKVAPDKSSQLLSLKVGAKTSFGPKSAEETDSLSQLLQRGGPVEARVQVAWSVPEPLEPPAKVPRLAPGQGSVQDRVRSLYDMQTVVVNFANVGATFAKKVLSKSASTGRMFDWEGVRRCVRFLRHELGMKPVGVVFENFSGPDNGRVTYDIPADIRKLCDSVEETPRLTGRHHKSADDEMTIKCAYRRNCCFMDNDNYRDWLQELRNAKIRSWLQESQDLLQMRYFFDSALGSFDTLDGNVPANLLAPGVR